MEKAIRFEFISSYAGGVDYRIVRPGHPDNGQRVELRHKIEPLYAPWRPGKRWFNYTPTRYAHMVARTKDYMWREYNATVPLDLEYARQYNADVRANWEAARAKYGDDMVDWPCPQLKGTAYLVKTGGDGMDATYDWVMVKL